VREIGKVVCNVSTPCKEIFFIPISLSNLNIAKTRFFRIIVSGDFFGVNVAFGQVKEIRHWIFVFSKV